MIGLRMAAYFVVLKVISTACLAAQNETPIAWILNSSDPSSQSVVDCRRVVNQEKLLSALKVAEHDGTNVPLIDWQIKDAIVIRRPTNGNALITFKGLSKDGNVGKLNYGWLTLTVGTSFGGDNQGRISAQILVVAFAKSDFPVGAIQCVGGS